ncbi:IMPACT family protein [Rhizobium halophytocola]|uniref:YigZ family protein n=1 Tax=Rhizobium halophytocola TaxID=735519 RepID=A0ABS4E1A5_9HYPH|nr:YigZ family protein [Rhizobium halophytocola]MBP1851722.1 putative YigZ family protein [Rhizobium halophytocola]
MSETLKAPAGFEQTVKKSRFLASAAPIVSEDEARAFLESHCENGANHNCWAYRIGQTYRFNDDGEPSGTAGKPILQAIDGQDLDGVVVVVTRWFGGILLGSGGLMRAYGGTAASCLRAAPRRQIILTTRRWVSVAFSDLALVKARLGAVEHAVIAGEAYDGDGCMLTVDLPTAGLDEICRMLTDITAGRAEISGEDG